MRERDEMIQGGRHWVEPGLTGGQCGSVRLLQGRRFVLVVRLPGHRRSQHRHCAWGNQARQSHTQGVASVYTYVGERTCKQR